jgi:hypothetical protein
MAASANEANNYSTIQFDLYLNSTNGQSYSGYPGQVINWSVGSVAGNSTAPSGASMAGGARVLIASNSYNLGHDANGYLGTVQGYGILYGSGGAAPGTIDTTASVGTQDFNRAPATPTFASLTRTVDAVAVTVNAVSSPAGTATYVITRSENGGAYGDTRSSTSRSATFSGLLKGSTHQFRVVASNTDGSSATTTSSTVSIPNVPTAPTITVGTPSGRAVNVSCGVSATNGAAITGYFIQASPDDGVTWETAISAPSRALAFTDLAGGTTMKWRTYSTNEMGSSLFTTSESIFIPSGGRRLTAEGFISTQTFTRLTASGPVPVGIARRLTASGWVELS